MQAPLVNTSDMLNLSCADSHLDHRARLPKVVLDAPPRAGQPEGTITEPFAIRHAMRLTMAASQKPTSYLQWRAGRLSSPHCRVSTARALSQETRKCLRHQDIHCGVATQTRHGIVACVNHFVAGHNPTFLAIQDCLVLRGETGHGLEHLRATAA